MSGRSSGGSSIGEAIGMAVLLFAIIMFIFIVAVVTFLASPGMIIVGSAKLVLGLAYSVRQLWVLSIALSATILIVLAIVRRNVAGGVAAHLLLCAVTMILWSVLTYGFEFKATEALAAVFFPGFTINGASAPAAAQALQGKPTGVDSTAGETEPAPASVSRKASGESAQAVPRRLEAVVPKAEPLPGPNPIPMASFQVALQLPLKRAYVMVRLNDREVFRCDFRPKDQAGTPGIVTPPIEATAGAAVVKVWVISPDQKAADEYVVLPVELRAAERRMLGLVFDPRRKLKSRLVAEPSLSGGIADPTMLDESASGNSGPVGLVWNIGNDVGELSMLSPSYAAGRTTTASGAGKRANSGRIHRAARLS